MRLAALIGGLALISTASAQHATESDIADGERAYGTTCVACHGPDGNLIPGIDFSRGQLRREYTDAELVGIILNGVPDTPMPPNPGMSTEQAERIVGFLRALAERGDTGTLVGNRGRGRDLFYDAGNCTDCHAVNGRGARHGPDLTSIGRTRGAAELEAALREPAAVVDPANRRVEVELGNGNVIAGRLLNHDTFTVQMIDDDDRLRSFDKTTLRDFRFVDTSMPDYGATLTSQDIADLVSYLVSLQGPRNE